MKRRKFLQQSALASVGTMWIPQFLKAFEVQNLENIISKPKILVIIQWSGGNDSLNTIIPYRNDIYYRERPRLAIPAAQVIPLTDELGLHPALSGLKRIFDAGHLNILNNVGYPNPDRSHFRAMDIWHTAANADQYLTSGWVGRYLDSHCPSSDCTIAHQAIEVDDTLSLAMKGENIKGLALKNPQKLYQVTQAKNIQHLANQKLALADHHHDHVAYLYKTLAETVSSASYIYEKNQVYQSKFTYPASPFAQQLKTIAQLINAGLETNIYYTSMGSFDTHVRQKPQQERLLKMYDEALSVFVQDLQANQRLQDVVIMTFSEFGRRVAQNASEGTDHGTAGNVFIIHPNLKKAGVFNEAPNLQDLDEGDLKFTLDFRDIYATLLDKHLQADSRLILNQTFQGLDLIK
ncbi:MAG: DUF1501 domain-containing protein [Microscillaceae bacterium]|jgi:uncharacterized protein (DUF1501 family)|nr:DUF1501 domain-containing protein [Microscillaceae bacterium]